MPYRFATDRPDYSDLASGKVLLAAPGHPAFSVRLGSEIFQRCLAILAENGLAGPFVLYDPCCGAAYHLAVLGFLHRNSIRAIFASDIDPRVIPLAEKNLAMLSPEGIDRRRDELTALHREFGKQSHADALAAAGRLRARIAAPSASNPIAVRVFTADALARPDPARFADNPPADLVFTDVPYGRHSRWEGESGDLADPVRRLLENLRPIVRPSGVVVVVSGKGRIADHIGFDRIRRFQIGKRMAVFWKPKP